MLKTEDILSYLLEKKDDFFSDYHLSKMGLFGSFAKQEAADDSDIDIIVEFKPNTQNLHELKSDLKEKIASHFDRKVDICREKYIKSYFKTAILKSVIYV